ncbi:MAG: zinc ribbon domain-containing protein [Acidobacteriota bacterium]|jgi:hypothetical protein
MENWRCSNCKTENRPEAKFCRACGEPLPEREQPETPAAAAGPSERPIQDMSRSILDEIRSDQRASFGKSRGALDKFKSSLPKLSDLKVDLKAEMPDLNALLKEKPHIARATTRDLKLVIRLHKRLNYVLAHCDRPFISSLEIFNASYEPAEDIRIRAWIATDYGEPWQKTVPSIPAQKSYVESNIVIPLSKSRLQQVRELEKANLRIDIFVEQELEVSQTIPIEVLPYNEWYYHPDFGEIIACFVQPNSEAIEKIISMVRDRLRRGSQDTSLDGYQSRDPAKVVRMLEALYLTLQQDLQLSYINPPPSFEQAEFLPDGSNTLSQKLFFPEQILKHRRGTCLDLALLGAACVERMGLDPLCFLIQGHAFFGAWLLEHPMANAAIKDHDVVVKLVSANAWLPLNSTTFASTPPRGFEECVAEGRYYLGDAQKFKCAVDVASARHHGFKPIPPMVLGPDPIAGPGSGGGYKK